MKVLKTIGLVLLSLIILGVIIGFLLPRHISVERSIAIKSTPEIVFNQINILKNWEQWSPWHHIDTAMKLSYSGPESGKDAAYSWSSDNKNVGNGKLTIIKSYPFDSIFCEMNFMEQGVSYSSFVLVKDSFGTRLTWSMQSDMGNNPIARYFGMFMDKMIGPDFEKGLNAIREIAEKTPATELKVEVVAVPEMVYIGVRDTGSMATMGAKMGKMYGELMAFIGKSGMVETGPPIARYYTWENNRYDFEACIPVDKPKASGNIKLIRVKAHNAAKVDYYGPYEKMDIAYITIEKWMKENNKVTDGQPWDEYITDPMKEKDPSKVLTKIYWPVR